MIADRYVLIFAYIKRRVINRLSKTPLEHTEAKYT